MAEPTESRSNREAQEFAQKAIFDAITAGVKEIRDSVDDGYTVSNQSSRLRDFAFAYRLAAGGAQPGSVEVTK